jgi:hypothetical protein
VPREQYELIWVEFYDHKPSALAKPLESTRSAALDAWLVMRYPDKVRYHKHRMYNAGIVLAQGQICVFCDSDAIFTPTFIESIVKAFEERPNAVVHLDEVRNCSKRFYPFNYPPLEDVLDDGCVNWTGTTTTGLDNHPDILHAANYGACMAARRDDLIKVGGADEHMDYLGGICGPYEMTFRLVNHGRDEHWLRNDYLYRVWQPDTSGRNVECKGPDDGRGVSLTSLKTRESGRVQPLKENPAIRQLREGSLADVRTLLTALVQKDDGAWHGEEAATSSAVPVGHEVYGDLTNCSFQGSKAHGLKALVLQGLLKLPLPSSVRNHCRELLGLTPEDNGDPRFAADDMGPHVVLNRYGGYNVVYWNGTWYALDQDEGAFDIARIKKRKYRRMLWGDSLQTVKASIRSQRKAYQRIASLAFRMMRLGQPRAGVAGNRVD